MAPIKTISRNGRIVEFYHDDDCPSPREHDNLGTLSCAHRRYNFGDENPCTLEEANKFDARFKDGVLLPVYLFDHSGITISTNKEKFSCIDPQRWDWGRVGSIGATRAKIFKEYGWKRLTKKRREQIEKHLQSEIEEMANYLEGNCYYLIMKNEKNEIVDSVSGFIGEKWANEVAEEWLNLGTIPPTDPSCGIDTKDGVLAGIVEETRNEKGSI